MPSDLESIAREVGAVVLSADEDGTGWRWRASWRGIQLGAWNDIDGVAVVADVGTGGDWVGLVGHPADPAPGEALAWAVATVGAWVDGVGPAVEES